MASKKEDIYDNVPVPAIAHVIMNKSYEHFVVIHKITNKYILVAILVKVLLSILPMNFFLFGLGLL